MINSCGWILLFWQLKSWLARRMLTMVVNQILFPKTGIVIVQ